MNSALFVCKKSLLFVVVEVQHFFSLSLASFVHEWTHFLSSFPMNSFTATSQDTDVRVS